MKHKVSYFEEFCGLFILVEKTHITWTRCYTILFKNKKKLYLHFLKVKNMKVFWPIPAIYRWLTHLLNPFCTSSGSYIGQQRIPSTHLCPAPGPPCHPKLQVQVFLPHFPDYMILSHVSFVLPTLLLPAGL